ncbi:Tc toxin subunit A [Pseudescherichia vulneris]|uniref:Tc toxin subunit A n=1 Tax=Pseudescherichia vulneris TaxID=566 RepID=UPI0028D870C4|nr:Tc toxin subunit A [Pseudescherichia vulneris]
MALLDSPALQQVETALKVSPGSFAKNNYRSVFDIARTSRKQFIADNMVWLGLRGGKAWDLAVGQAQHIRRLFREKTLTRQIREEVQRQTLSGQPVRRVSGSDNIQGLVQNGPTWQNQFAENWQAYCQSGAPEAVDSPVSYLTWLYKQALSFEEEIKASGTAEQVIPLAERRPDLAALTVDNDAINQQVPALQLVNEILENSIAPSLPSEQSVDETLAETRYPTLLPYHFPHDQVALSLESAGVALEGVIGETATDWPWFLNDTWQGARSASSTELASGLAPEQQTLVTEADNSTGSDLKSFYTANLGLETADYTPFEDINTFTRQLGLTVPQVEALVAGNVGGTSVTVSDNCDIGSFNASDYGASFINSNTDNQPITINLKDTDSTDPDEITFDEGSHPVALTMSDSGFTHTDGRFDSGLRCDATQQAVMYLADNISTDGTSLKNFTITFWCKIPADVPDLALVITNKTDHYAKNSKGISLFAKHNDDDYQLELTASDGATDPLLLSYSFTPNTWVFLAIRYNGNAKLYLRGSSDGATMNITNSIDISSLGNIALTTDYWGFNGNIDSHYYNAYPERRAVITYDDITTWDRALEDEEIEKFITSNKPAAGYSGMYHYYPLNGMSNNWLSGLSDARMDRINRMVRLQRWLGLSYEEIDLLLSACIRAQGKNNKDFALNAHTLRALGVFRHWQQKYAINAFQFAAVLDEITPYAISPAVPFLDQVFNAPSLFDEPFAITGENVSYTEVTGDSARTVRQICAGLDITQAQFRVLADKVAAAQGDAQAKTFPLTLPVVSALYRLAMVPRWLGLSFADGAALLSLAGEGDAAWTTLAGVQQLAALSNGQPADGDILDLLMALDAAAEWASDHKLSWVKNYLTLQPGSDALAATSATVNFVNGIKQQLPAAQIRELGINGLPLSKSGFISITGGSTPVGSPLGAAHGTQLDPELGQYATFSSVANALADGDASYSIGMWVKITSDQTEGFPVLTNAAGYDHSNSPGIAIYNGGISPHGKGEYQLFFSVVSDETDRALSRDNTGLNFECGKWFWLGLATDVVQKSATVYAWSEDGSIKSSAALTWEGSLMMASGNVWALAQTGTLDGVLGKNSVFVYDDVTLWDSVLTEDDIAAIVVSGKPATKTIPATLTNSDIFADLVDDNGLVLPAASNYEIITQKVSADIASTGITFHSDADREQAISSLSGIINQARLAQNGIADSALAQMFSTGQSLPPYLLSWAGDSEYHLLSDSLAMNNGAALTDPSQVPATYLTDLFALGQRAGISRAFTLTPAALSIFLAHPDWFGVSDTTLSLTLLYRFSRYGDWLTVTGDEDRVLAYLSWVNGDTPPDGVQAADALALLLVWESSEVADATAALPGGLAKTVTDVDYVMRLQQLSTETGLSVTPLLAAGELVPGGVTETWDAWQSAGESLVAAQSGQQ